MSAIRSRVSLCLAAIVLLALAIRMAHLHVILGTAFPRLPLVYTESDMHTFWEWSHRILAGDWLGRNTYHPYTGWMKQIAPMETWQRWWGSRLIYHEAPLYPYLVAVLLRLSGDSLPFVLGAQLALGALQPLTMFALGRRLFDERVGLLAAAITALYAPFVFYQGVLLRDWLPPFVEPLFLLALVRARDLRRPGAWGLAGAALGVTLLVKSTMQLFLPFLVLWIAWEHRRAPREGALALGALALAAALAVSPLVARNLAVGAPPLSMENRAAEGLTDLAADSSPLIVTPTPSMERLLRRSGGRICEILLGVVATYHGDVRKFLGLEALKLQGLLDPLELPDNLNFYYGLDISPVLRALPRYGMLAPFGLAGLILVLPLWRRHLPILLYAVAVIGGLLITIPIGRYRMMLAPVWILYGSAGPVRALDRARRGNPRPAAAWVALVAGIGAVSWWLLPIDSMRDHQSIMIHGPEYAFSAQIYARDGRFDRAAAEMARFRARTKGRPAFAWAGAIAALWEGDYRAQWALRLLARGDRRGAEAQARQAERDYAEAPRQADVSWNLANLYAALGDGTRTRHFAEKFLAVEPAGPRADRARRWIAGGPP